MELPSRDKSRALLIGVSSYAASIPNIRAATNNVTELGMLLTDPFLGRISPENCTILQNPSIPADLNKQIVAAAREAEDTLIFYFAGHGMVGERDDLYLALSGTSRDDLRHTALSYDAIRDAMRGSPALRRIAIIDCCFSGRIISSYMSDKSQFVIAQVGVQGVYALASTSPSRPAIAPAGERLTAFTGELISLLRGGIEGGAEYLTFDEIFPHLVRNLTQRGLPKPLQSGTDTVAHLAIARNSAFVRPSQADHVNEVVNGVRKADVAGVRGGWLDRVDVNRQPEFVNPPTRSEWRPRFVGRLIWTVIWALLTVYLGPADWPLLAHIALVGIGIIILALIGSSSFSSRRRAVGGVATLVVLPFYGWAIVDDWSRGHSYSAVGIAFQGMLLASLSIAFSVTARDFERYALIADRRRQQTPEEKLKEAVESNPLTNILRRSRWIGESIESSFCDRLSYLPAARFVSFSATGPTPERSHVGVPEGTVGPDFAAICGNRVVLTYRTGWPAGIYSWSKGVAVELRKDGSLFQEGAGYVDAVAENINLWRARIADGEVMGILVLDVEERRINSRHRSKKASLGGEIRFSTQYDGDLEIFLSAEIAAEAAGLFLSPAPYWIDLSIVEILAGYSQASEA